MRLLLIKGLMLQPIPYQGSKRRLAPIILKFFPSSINTLYEPFAGSAAVSLEAARHKHAKYLFLNDSFTPLMRIWGLIIKDPHRLADGYEKLWKEQASNPRNYYDYIRDRFNQTQNPIDLLYLLVRCVKNAVRFNNNGKFNQSPDKRRLGTRPEQMRKRIIEAHRLLNNKVTISASDYTEILAKATPKDLVYLDPPYQGVSGKRDRRYYEQLDYNHFIHELEKLRKRSVPFILSFDGEHGIKNYGKPIPTELGLIRIEIHVGKSAQATLNGKNIETVESLYITPEVL